MRLRPVEFAATHLKTRVVICLLINKPDYGTTRTRDLAKDTPKAISQMNANANRASENIEFASALANINNDQGKERARKRALAKLNQSGFSVNTKSARFPIDPNALFAVATGQTNGTSSCVVAALFVQHSRVALDRSSTATQRMAGQLQLIARWPVGSVARRSRATMGDVTKFMVSTSHSQWIVRGETVDK